MNPIGLTSAEQAQETASVPIVQPPAPDGVLQCRVVTLPEGKVCGAIATGWIVWNKDDPKTSACDDCARRMNVQARTFGGSVRFESLSKEKT